MRRWLPALVLLLAVALIPSASRRVGHVNPYLPWHAAVVDRDGKLVAWYRPQDGLGFDHVLHIGWEFLEDRVPVDPRTNARVYLGYAVFDEQTLRGVYWQHNPASLYASLVDSLVGWYAYSGDRRAVALVREALDYQLLHGTTPPGWAWAGVPFASGCAGDREYGRCLAGLPRGYYGGLEPDKVGLLGLGYLRFFELTGDRRYLAAALRCADALARNVRPGDTTHTPWAFRVDGRTGRTLGGAEYGGMVVAPVRLFDELVRQRLGRTSVFRRARDLAWSWIVTHQLDRTSPDFNRWSGYYEDVAYWPDDVNQASASASAEYLATRPRPAAPDSRREDARALLRWVRASFGRGPFHGAWGIDEQHDSRGRGCCSPAGLGSDTAHWAAAQALLAARTGDPRAHEAARRSLAYATYFARSDGRVSCCGAGFRHPYWFSDGYGDYLGSISRALGALPELAPRGQDHVLGSTSVVASVAYGRRRVAYRTFDARAVDVIRLSYRPRRVLAGGVPLAWRTSLGREGYVVRPLPRGDFVVRVRHESARAVAVLG